MVVLGLITTTEPSRGCGSAAILDLECTSYKMAWEHPPCAMSRVVGALCMVSIHWLFIKPFTRTCAVSQVKALRPRDMEWLTQVTQH